jgi:enoyl-CoA hydratase/carnithine racemase
VIGALKRLVAQVLPQGPIEHMVEVSQIVGRVRASEDMQEGIRAYKERRKPRFAGR